jgi:glycosyltransferase involved in cell wall biosynthesis
VGWNWSVQAARHGHNVMTITRANNRSAIASELEKTPIENLQFHYFDLPERLMRWKKRHGFVGLYAYYYLWQICIWFIAKRLHREHRFDILHHVTFVNDWMPSGVAGAASRTPFVWGPVGGSTHVMPPRMAASLPPEFRRYERVRKAFQQLMSRLDPLVAGTRRRATVILTYTDEALEGIPARHRCKARSIVHIGVSDSDVVIDEANRETATPFTVVSGGRLVHWKGLDLVVEGFADFVRATGDAYARLVFTGRGPYRPYLEALVASHGLAAQVAFLGHLPSRDDVYRAVRSAHLYALPTLRDGPPVAILEAMLAARPVLCLDLGATRELVPDDAGLRIRFADRASMIRDIGSAFAWAAAHRAELDEMGRAARQQALTRHDWRRIGDEVESIYRAIAEQSRSSDEANRW